MEMWKIFTIPFVTTSTDTNDLQQKMYNNMLSDEVTQALQSLPEDFRTVVILCDIEGLTYEEISDFLNCPIGTSTLPAPSRPKNARRYAPGLCKRPGIDQ